MVHDDSNREARREWPVHSGGAVPAPIKRTIGRVKKALTPSDKTVERIEWTVAGIVVLLGTIVAVEVLAAIAAVMM